MKATIQGNLAVLSQAFKLIKQLSADDYHTPIPPLNSSIGQHIRHVLDHYLHLQRWEPGTPLDYDQRKRGTDIEFNPVAALQQIEALQEWLERLLYLDNQPMTLCSLVVDNPSPVTCATSFQRELLFSASHAVHHYALISVILKLKKIPVDDTFGVAPATLQYQQQ
ncbi:DinB family protein [Spartinivicinus ruber]|uniref:DinB family protein n=1 Tax=Spartinivicinus ruber TaxID=2683272 RepID=UPI0013D4F9C1|nr:DinB family protein [Spartinivicinus ruber]